MWSKPLLGGDMGNSESFLPLHDRPAFTDGRCDGAMVSCKLQKLHSICDVSENWNLQPR